MLATPHLCSQEIPWVCTPPFRPVMLNSPCSYGWCRNFWESLEGLCGSGRFPHNALKFLSFRRNVKEALSLPDCEKNPFSLVLKNQEITVTVSSTSRYGWLIPFVDAPSGFPLDGPPLLNAHNPVGCSGTGWLCPPLLISAGTQRKARHAMLVPSSISNLEIAECIYKSLSSNLLNPWSPIPLELSHSATTHKLQKTPFPALASVFLCTGCDF